MEPRFLIDIWNETIIGLLKDCEKRGMTPETSHYAYTLQRELEARKFEQFKRPR